MGVEGILEAVVWICVGLQLYHYVVYPILLGGLRAVFPRRPNPKPADLHSVSLIISAYDEEGVISEKLRNCLELDPAPSEVIVVTDGSRDRTPDVARGFDMGSIPFMVLHRPERRGKAAAMTRAAEFATSDILLFSDANAEYSQGAVGAIAREFADPSVAVVSGSKKMKPRVKPSQSAALAQSDGLYWRYEAFIRQCESDLGATVASVGEILAVRRDDWRPIPAGTVNDDAWITLSSLARGRNVRFARDAVSLEDASPDASFETVRRRRICAGRLNLLGRGEIWPWRRPAVLMAFLSHKVLRVLLPIPMIVGLAANVTVVALEAGSSGVMHALLVLQVLALAIAAMGFVLEKSGRKSKLPSLAYHVLRGNMSALLAMWDLLKGRSHTVWQKPPR